MQGPSSSGTNTNNKEDEKIVQYDQDVLSIAKSMEAKVVVQPIQLIHPQMAWGGCISYERKTCRSRDSLSVIQNIAQATAAEAWVAPDM